MSADLDLSNIRAWLDEQERYAASIGRDDPRAEVARQMLANISEARGRLLPSADSTANYVPNKRIVEELSVLRDKAEQVARAVGV